MPPLPFLTAGPAACATHPDPDLWHSTAATAQRAAVRVCTGCPLRAACADHALTVPEREGVWGGLTADERHRLLNPADGSWLDAAGRVRRACGTEAALGAHWTYGEMCVTCQGAHEARVLARRQELLAAAHEAGGTNAGAQMHRRLQEPVCGLCAAAAARYQAQVSAARQRPAQPRVGVLAA